MNNKISPEAQYFIDYCWKNEEPRVITLVIDTTYEIDNKKYKLTEGLIRELIKEIESTNRVRVWSGGKKSYNLMGLKGRYAE